MLQQPFYDPTKSYEANFSEGPFGAFADGKTIKHTGEPTHTFLGHQVYVPFGIPAGPLINSKYVTAAFQKGFDIATYKTVRTRQHPSHQHPNVLAVHIDGDLTLAEAEGELTADTNYTEPLSITNSFGVPSKDPDVWQPDMAKAAQSAGNGQVMVGSFQGTKDDSGSVQNFIEDYVLAARLVKEAGATILEANLSCPNEGTADLLCFDIERVQLISQRIKDEVGDLPLILKFAYFDSDEHLSAMIAAVGEIVQGISAINTIPASIIDAKGNQALPGEGRLRSGVCGAGIKWAGLEMTERLYKLRDEQELEFTIIGVGGVTTAEDYKEYRDAGADAVQSATGSMWKPDLASEIYAQKENRR
jgi:dihydroorotate dehydrogenase